MSAKPVHWPQPQPDALSAEAHVSNAVSLGRVQTNWFRTAVGIGNKQFGIHTTHVLFVPTAYLQRPYYRLSSLDVFDSTFDICTHDYSTFEHDEHRLEAVHRKQDSTFSA